MWNPNFATAHQSNNKYIIHSFIYCYFHHDLKILQGLPLLMILLTY